MSNNQSLNNNTLRNVINNEDKHESIYQSSNELELDVSLTINFPRINIDLIIEEIINKHDYVLIEINQMSIKELRKIIKTHPNYITERIHECYVIEAAIFDALTITTKSNIFYDLEYMFAHSKEKITKSMYRQYYSQIYDPIIQVLNKISHAYLRFVLFLKITHQL